MRTLILLLAATATFNVSVRVVRGGSTTKPPASPVVSVQENVRTVMY